MVCRIAEVTKEYRPPVSYFTTIGGAVGYGRRSDVTKLKDLRRRLDSGQCTLEEIDAITIDVMDESAEVSWFAWIKKTLNWLDMQWPQNKLLLKKNKWNAYVSFSI